MGEEKEILLRGKVCAYLTCWLMGDPLVLWFPPLRRQIREGRMYVGFDVDDAGLGFAVQKAGREAFVFGSDFPHEVFNAEKCRKEIDELLSRSDLTPADKEAVLGGNARRFYGFDESTTLPSV